MRLKEIAAHFGVSVSTVSKALRDSHEISDALKSRIQAFAKENRYKPNPIAINLKKRSTKTIGVVIPNILNYFFVRILHGIEQVADERGYSIISCISDRSLDKEAATLELLGAGTVDGLIISTVAKEHEHDAHREHLEQIVSKKIPMVMFDRVIEGVACDKVIVDDEEAGYKATSYLLGTGCKRIALLSPMGNAQVGRLRLEGYKRALQEKDVPFTADRVISLGPKDDLDFQMSFLLNQEPLDAILALDEITAVKAMRIVKERGYQVPQDIAVIGFTNGILSEYVTPALTVISQHGTFIGQRCATILLDRIEGKNTGPMETKVVKTSLIVRDSTQKL